MIKLICAPTITGHSGVMEISVNHRCYLCSLESLIIKAFIVL